MTSRLDACNSGLAGAGVIQAQRYRAVYLKEPVPWVKLLTRDQFWTNVTSIVVDRAAELTCY